MNGALRDALALLPSELPAFIRIATAMMLMPGLGEAAIPAMVRVGLSLAVGVCVTASLPAPAVDVVTPSAHMMMAVVGEAITGLWFGWLCRLVALALPIAGQYAGYMIGLSNVLQADANSGEQNEALGALFGLASPMFILASGLYRLQIQGLVGLFGLIPIGHLLPAADGAAMSVRAVSAVMTLALQLASPFVVIAVLWNLFIGQLARLGGRLQIYFISFPGQILLGIALLLLSVGPMLSVWLSRAGILLDHLPGAG